MSALWENSREEKGRKTVNQVCRRPSESGRGKSVPGENAALDEIEIGVAAHDRQRPLGYVTSVRLGVTCANECWG